MPARSRKIAGAKPARKSTSKSTRKPAAGSKSAGRKRSAATTRRRPESPATNAVTAQQQPLRICFERIIPDDLDPERSVRRVLASQMMATSGAQVLNADDVAHAKRMSVITSKKWWQPDKARNVLRCRFLDGTPKMKDKVRRLAKEWEKHANVQLKFVQDGPAEIRISFYADAGSWSAVGRDALNRAYFPLHQPTMNFGWVRDDSDPLDDRAVVLHEFGHALGCIHEHQAPTFSRKWNEKQVLKYFRGAPNYWDDAAIRANVLAKYSPRGIQSSRFDPASIMLYAFDGRLFSDGLGPTNQNAELSEVDKAMIRRMYP